MTVLRRLPRAVEVLVRVRTPLLLAWGLPWFWQARARTLREGPGDWVGAFEYGARSLIGYTDRLGHTYATGGLHLYANNPQVQVGPPPLLLLSAFQWARIPWVTLGFSLLMLVVGPLALRALEACFATDDRTRRTSLLAGLLVMPAWAYWLAGYYRHLDDVFALGGIAAAMLLCARQRPVLAGLVLGTAVASKPWAIVAVPLLLGLERRHRGPAVLVTLAAAAAWWAPFVLAAPGTASALGSYGIEVDPGSVLALLGAHGHAEGWLRPVQFDAGIALAVLVGLRVDWRLAALAGLAVRVAFDPFVWDYYGVGPLLLAVTLDLWGGRRLPWWTAATGVVFFVLAREHARSTDLAAAGKAVWVLAVLVPLVAHALRGWRPARRAVPVAATA